MFSLSLSLGFLGTLALIALLCLYHYRAIKVWREPRETISLPTTTKCSPNLDTLPSISLKNTPCCYNNGLSTGGYYLQASDSELKFSVVPVATYFGTVCREYCSNGSTLDTLEGTVSCLGSDPNGQRLANKCLERLKPVGCQASAYPVAVLNSTPYFALHALTSKGVAECSPGVCRESLKVV